MMKHIDFKERKKTTNRVKKIRRYCTQVSIQHLWIFVELLH